MSKTPTELPAEAIPANASGLVDVAFDGGNLFSGPDRSVVRTAPGELPPMIPGGSSIYDQLNLVYDVHVRVFDLSKPEDMKDYIVVMNELGHRTAELSVEERKWSEATGNFIVFLRWCRRVYQAPIPAGKPLKQEMFHGQRRTVIR